MLQNNAYLPTVSAKVPWQRCLAGKGSTSPTKAPAGSFASSTVPSPDRGSVAGSSARTTTSSWASTPTLAASKAIVPGFTLAGSGATVHSESSTVTLVSAVGASPVAAPGGSPVAAPGGSPVAAPGGSPATAPAWRQATAAQAARTTSQAACRTQVAVVTAR